MPRKRVKILIFKEEISKERDLARLTTNYCLSCYYAILPPQAPNTLFATVTVENFGCSYSVNDGSDVSEIEMLQGMATNIAMELKQIYPDAVVKSLVPHKTIKQGESIMVNVDAT